MNENSNNQTEPMEQAGQSESIEQTQDLEKYLVFNLKDKYYALQSKIISEVAVLEKVFPLPLVPEYVLGIINRYSVPYALIDLDFLISGNISSVQKIIVLKEEIDKLAFLIDDVTDIIDISPDLLIKTDVEENALEPGPGSIYAYFEWKGSPVFCLDTGIIINRIKQDFIAKT